MAEATHPWILTGPWYRWPKPGVPATGRGTKPEIQKYAGFDFAAEFLHEPQRSLEWKDEDYLHRTIANTAALPATLAGILRAQLPNPTDVAVEQAVGALMAIVDKISPLPPDWQGFVLYIYLFACFTDPVAAGGRLIAALVDEDSDSYVDAVPERRQWLLEELSYRSNCPTSLGAWLREKTQIRKLYKPAHARSYLVVAELSCDRPGLPRVARGEVAEAGFVIRRLRARADDPQVALAATTALQQVALAREQVAYLQRNARGRIRSAAGLVLQHRLERPAIKKQHELLERWSAGKLKLDELAAAGLLQLVSEAWSPDPADPLRGRWKTVEDPTPRLELGGEASELLSALIPDPREPDHTGARRTLYFGVIPTGGREAELDGTPRFDERHVYEIRCFVRRQPSKPGCPGELVWSEATIGYRVAHDADPEGTANLPLSITVPSFNEVKAFADQLATGGGGGMRIVQPPDSMMPLAGTFPDISAGEKSGIGQICFLAILLLFLIALFLVFAFLPIIVFLFQLFFLLRLKFCIPPALDFSVDIAVELKAQLDVELAAGFDFEAFAGVMVDKGLAGTDEGEVNVSSEAAFSEWVNKQLAAVYEGELLTQLQQAPLAVRVQRLVDLRTDFRDSVEPELAADLNFAAWGEPVPDTEAGEAMSPPLPSGRGELEYYPIIDPREVFA
jgi:hypothetical protein